MNRKAPIIVDGANVAHWHGKNNFSCRGLLLCLAYFQKRGHQNVYIILPQRWDNKNELVDRHVLTQLHQSGLISFVPVGNSDDDFIIHFAQIKNAIIVTNDRFIKETNLRQDWKIFIQNRILTYTFVEDDFVPNPNPLNTGVNLETFLTGRHLGEILTGSIDVGNRTTDDLLNEVLNNKSKKSTDALLSEVLNNKLSTAAVDKENKKQANRPNTERQKPKESAAVKGGQKKPAPVNKRPSNDGPQKVQPGGSKGSTVRQQSNPPMHQGFEHSLPSGGINTAVPPPTFRGQQPAPCVLHTKSDQGLSETFVGGGVFNGAKPKNTRSQSARLSNTPQPVSVGSNFKKDNQQRTSKGEQGDAGTNPKARYVYGMAVVEEVQANYGRLSLPNLKNTVIFYANAYRSNCVDLTKEFSKGKTVAVGYTPLPPTADPTEAIQALVVCPTDELVHGYGKIAGDLKFHGVLVSPIYATFGRQVYCPANTYNDKSVPFKDLSINCWLDFYAMPQYPLEAKRPYVSVNTILIRTEGVIVRTTPAHAVVWSRLAGHVAVRRDDGFRLGVWLNFRLMAGTPFEGCLWHGVDARIIGPKITTTIGDDGQVVLCDNAHAGFLSNGGNLYCKSIGRIGLTDECRYQCQPLKLNPMQKVTFAAKYNNPPKLTLGDVVWTAFDVKPRKFQDNNKAHKSLMIKDVQATVESIFAMPNGGRVMSASLKMDSGNGTIYAEACDCEPTFNMWKAGDRVKGAVIAQEFPLETWRAFCVAKVP